MQNTISYRSLRALFSPVELLTEAESSPNKAVNTLTQIMPIEQIIVGISKSYTYKQPVYITTRRQIANLNTKDILFGLFRSNYNEDGMILFEDVDNDITRMIRTDDILAIRRPNN